MIDSMLLHFPDSSVDPDRLLNVRCYAGDVFRGRIKNLIVKQEMGSVSISGSLPKFLSGQNVLTLDGDDLPVAYQEIGNSLDLDLDKAFVRQIEVSRTFAVEASPRSYINAWTCHPRLHKDTREDGSTVLFHNKTWSFQGYDKGRECGYDEVERLLGTRNALRLELKLKKSIRRMFGRPIMANDLLDPALQACLVEMFIKAYQGIEWHRSYDWLLDDARPAAVIKGLATVGLNVIGPEVVYGKKAELSRAKKCSTCQASRMRQNLRLLSHDVAVVDSQDLSEELDRKILDWAEPFLPKAKEDPLSQELRVS